jgi:hypothetical protein
LCSLFSSRYFYRCESTPRPLAWALIFLHFFVEAFETHQGTLETIIESIDIAALELSGVVFVTSMIHDVEIRSKRLGLLALLGIPVVFHAVVASFDWHIFRTMSAALALIFFGAAIFTRGRRDSTFA